jgi:hypothetical protein
MPRSGHAGFAETRGYLVHLSAAVMPIDDRVLRKRLPGSVAAKGGQRRSWAEVRQNLACERAGEDSGRTNRVPRAFHELWCGGQSQATRA